MAVHWKKTDLGDNLAAESRITQQQQQQQQRHKDGADYLPKALCDRMQIARVPNKATCLTKRQLDLRRNWLAVSWFPSDPVMSTKEASSQTDLSKIIKEKIDRVKILKEGTATSRLETGGHFRTCDDVAKDIASRVNSDGLFFEADSAAISSSFEEMISAAEELDFHCRLSVLTMLEMYCAGVLLKRKETLDIFEMTLKIVCCLYIPKSDILEWFDVLEDVIHLRNVDRENEWDGDTAFEQGYDYSDLADCLIELGLLAM